jgi:addiction module HigA family antidote
MGIRIEDLSSLDFSGVVEPRGRRVPPPHPGEILLEEFLKPMGITQYRLAKAIGVPQRRIGEIVAGTRGVSADTGLRLSRFFGMSEGFWIGLQAGYEQAVAKEAIAKTLAKIRPWEWAGSHVAAS